MSGQRVPAFQQLGAAVLVQGPCVLDVEHALAVAVRNARRNGVSPDPRVLGLQATVQAAAGQVRAMAGIGQPDTNPAAVHADSEPMDSIGTAEVAALLRLSQRQAQRLAPSLDAHRLDSGALVFDRHTVQTYALDRQETAA